DHLEDDCARARVRALDVDTQSWHGLQQACVERTHLVAADIVRAPRLVIVVRSRPKGAHDGVEVMGIFMPHVLVDKLEARRQAIVVRGRHATATAALAADAARSWRSHSARSRAPCSARVVPRSAPRSDGTRFCRFPRAWRTRRRPWHRAPGALSPA